MDFKESSVKKDTNNATGDICDMQLQCLFFWKYLYFASTLEGYFHPYRFLSFSLSPFFLALFLSFLAAPAAYGGSQTRGRIGATAASLPELQQCRIWAMSSTYTTAHGNSGSPAHWARPGIKPASSLILVRFITTEPQGELQVQISKLVVIYFQPFKGVISLCGFHNFCWDLAFSLIFALWK